MGPIKNLITPVSTADTTTSKISTFPTTHFHLVPHSPPTTTATPFASTLHITPTCLCPCLHQATVSPTTSLASFSPHPLTKSSTLRAYFDTLVSSEQQSMSGVLLRLGCRARGVARVSAQRGGACDQAGLLGFPLNNLQCSGCAWAVVRAVLRACRPRGEGLVTKLASSASL
jgi:hypothetical protein